MRYTLVLILLFSGPAFADGDTWIRKNNPDELFVANFTNGCPFSEETLSQETRGVVIRSRISPLDGWIPGEVLLFVAASCVRDDDLYIYDLDVYLAKFEINDDDDVVISRTFQTYSSFGQGPSEYILDAVEESVEAAITDYLVANFDL